MNFDQNGFPGSDKMAKGLIKCKKCGEEKLKETSFTRKEKQVTCDDCLDKAKTHRATLVTHKVIGLEKQVEDLKKQLEVEREEKRYYQEKFENFAGKYSDLCIKIGELNFIDKVRK
jgi:hypothetical protein